MSVNIQDGFVRVDVYSSSKKDTRADDNCHRSWLLAETTTLIMPIG